MMLRARYKGMTTFEVIIAIIVFGTGILVILSMVTKNVSWLRDVKQKDTAIMLAKEGLEIVYNLRDTNTDKGIIWNCAEYNPSSPNSCANYFHESNTGSSYFEVDWSTTGSYSMVEVGGTGSTWIYFHSGNIESTSGAALWSGFWYNHYRTGGSLTEYRRTIVFRPVTAYPNNTGNILTVEAYVYYLAGNTLRHVVLESLVGKTR